MEFRFTPSCDSGGSSLCASQGIKPPTITPAASKSQHTEEGGPELGGVPVVGPTQNHMGFLSHHRDQNAAVGQKFLFTYYVKIKRGQAHLKQLQMAIKSCVSEENEEIKCLSLFTSDNRRGSGSKFKGPFSKFVENWTSKYKISLQSFELEYTFSG